MTSTGTLLEPRPLTRADIANALVDVIWDDRQLANAITVNEAWKSGYIARLLTHAEVLAAQSSNHDPMGPEPITADDAVRRALDAVNPRQVFLRYSSPVHEDARHALVTLLKAQAQFHTVAAPLERRGLRRHPLPA